MGWLKTHFDKIILAVLPIPFIGSCFFNCLTFFMDGHQHGWLRSGITLGMQAIALCLILIELFACGSMNLRTGISSNVPSGSLRCFCRHGPGVADAA